MYREELEKLCRRRCGLCQQKWKEFQEKYVAQANGKPEQICRKAASVTPAIGASANFEEISTVPMRMTHTPFHSTLILIV